MTESPQPSRLESFLAYSAVTLIGISLLSLFTGLILQLFELSNRPAILIQLPLIGLPVGFVLVLALLFAAIRRRSRENGRP